MLLFGSTLNAGLQGPVVIDGARAVDVVLASVVLIFVIYVGIRVALWSPKKEGK